MYYSPIDMKQIKLLPLKEEERRLKNSVLPKMAGLPSKRTRIGSKMMNFLAENGHLYFVNYPDLCSIIYEIGLQRISCGPVMHPDDRLHTFTALPQAYRRYGSLAGSKGCYPERMDRYDEKFLYKCLEECILLPTTRTHGLAVCFGLVRYLDPDGSSLCHYELGSSSYHPSGVKLYNLADYLINRYATIDEIMNHWATPRQWKRHQATFSQLAKRHQLDWKKFFQTTHLFEEENFFQRLRLKNQLKAQMTK